MRNLTIQALSKLSGVQAVTIRAWERRYNAVTPQRTPTNRRLYSFHDLERVRLLKELTQNGHAISQIAGMSLTNLKKILEQNFSQLPPDHPPALEIQHTQEDQRKWVHAIIEHLKAFELNKLNDSINYARLTLGSTRFVLEVATPVFQTVGKMVASGQLSISQEHTLSAILRNQFVQLLMSLTPLANPHLKTIGLCTREGDHHEFGILLTSVLCAQLGFPVVYFGTNLPADSLAEASKSLHLKYLIVGTTQLPPEHEVISNTQYAKEIRDTLNKSTKVWMGGMLSSQEKASLLNYNIQILNSFQDALDVLNSLKDQQLKNIEK